MIVHFDCNGFRVSGNFDLGNGTLDPAEAPELDHLRATDGVTELVDGAVWDAFGGRRLLHLAERAYWAARAAARVAKRTAEVARGTGGAGLASIRRRRKGSCGLR